MNSEINLRKVILYIKRNLKLIIIPSIVVSIFFLVGAILSSVLIGDESEVTQDDSLIDELEEYQSVPFEDLTPVQQTSYLEYLAKNAYYFRFYVEHEDSDAFTAPYLLEEILLQNEVIEFVENRAGVDFSIDPEIALTVTKGESNVIHELQVGTGNRLNNQKLTSAFKSALEEGITPFLENKRFYIISDQVLLRENDETENLIEQVELAQGNNMIYTIIMTLVGGVLGFVLGIIISLLRTPMLKETHELYEFVQNPTDLYIDFSNYSKQDVEEKKEKLNHAILYPSSSKKAVLIEQSLSNKISNELIDVKGLRTKNISVNSDVAKFNPSAELEEVVILVVRNSTTKQWYESQRMQLRNYTAIIKIIEC